MWLIEAIRKMQTRQNDALRVCERIRDPRGVDIEAMYVRNNIPKLLPAWNLELLSPPHKLSQDPDNIVTTGRDL